MSSPGAVQWILWQGARLLHYLDMSDLAAQLIGASDAILEEKSHVRNGYENKSFKEVGATVRGSLGEDAFDSAYRSGLEMDGHDAHDLLLATLEEQTGQSS